MLHISRPQNKLRWWLSSWVFVGLIGLIINTDKLSEKVIFLPVTETNKTVINYDSLRPKIKEYLGIVILGSPQIQIENPSLVLRILSPSQSGFFFDNIYSSLIFITALFCIVQLWNFNYLAPFKQRLSKTLIVVAIIFLIFFAIDAFRIYWLEDQIKSMTKNEYRYPFNFFSVIEFWIAIGLIRIGQIVKKGEKLQKEQDLTI